MLRYTQSVCVVLAIAVAAILLVKSSAQVNHTGATFIAAVAKGPNQINLVWPALSDTHYGYLVEIQSASDTRYAQWTELQPIPTATGYKCDNSVVYQGGTCNISDPSGAHVYNPATNGVPDWVTDANYTDPQDDS